MSAVKLYQAPLYSNKPRIRLLDWQSANPDSGVMFKRLPTDFRIHAYSLVQSPDDADFIIVPQSIKKVTPAWRVYFDTVLRLARSHNKKVILFLSGDLCHRIHIDESDVIVCKGSEYAHAMRDNEIVFAPFVEDLGKVYGYVPRTKQIRPTVSFCGYAGFPSLRTKILYILRNTILTIYAFVSRNPLFGAYKRGIYFRRIAMRALSSDDRVVTKFVVRNSFSGNTHTTDAGLADTIRQEYIHSIMESDFVLAPKGDANFSSRFYEVLSLGRIPVLIDTDMPLPLEHIVDYKSFIVRVPHTDVNRAGDYIMRVWDSLTDSEYIAMQKKAQEAYWKYLRYDAYFNMALPVLRELGAVALR